MLGKIGKIGLLLLSLLVLFAGANLAQEGRENQEAEPTPTRTTVADYVKSNKFKRWVVLTDAKINLLKAVTVTTTTTTTNKKTHELVSSKTAISKLYIPIEAAGSTQNDTVSLLLETDDAEILDVASQLKAKSEAELLQFIVRERGKLIRSVELSGLMKGGGNVEIEIRKHIKNLAGDFYILQHNQQLVLGSTEGLITMGIGLFMLFLSLFSLRRKKDDSQVQPATSPIPHSPSIPLPPEKMPRYYKILEISRSAGLEEIKQAALAKSNDIKTALSCAVMTRATAQASLNEIEEAFKTLSEPETRAAYDPQWQPVKDSQQNLANQVSKQVAEAVIDKYIHEIHQGSCPQCHGPGPVDVHTSYWVWSLLLYTHWYSRSQICCQSCGTKSKIGGALFSLVCGWWGVPFGLIITPLQIIENVVSLLYPPDPLKLETMLKQQLASKGSKP